MSVLRQTHPFTDYIYVDRDEACVDALRARVEPLARGARISILQFRFSTIRALVDLKMDFLVLLMLDKAKDKNF